MSCIARALAIISGGLTHLRPSLVTSRRRLVTVTLRQARRRAWCRAAACAANRVRSVRRRLRAEGGTDARARCAAAPRPRCRRRRRRCRARQTLRPRRATRRTFPPRMRRCVRACAPARGRRRSRALWRELEGGGLLARARRVLQHAQRTHAAEAPDDSAPASLQPPGEYQCPLCLSWTSRLYSRLDAHMETCTGPPLRVAEEPVPPPPAATKRTVPYTAGPKADTFPSNWWAPVASMRAPGMPHEATCGACQAGLADGGRWRACSTASPAAFRTAGRSSCRRLRRRRPLRREPLRPRVACLLRTSRTAAAARVPSGDARASLPPAKSATRSAAGRPSLTLRVGPQQAAGLTACRMSRRSSKAWNSHGDLAPCDPRKRKLDRTRHQRRSRRRARSCSRCIKSVQVPPQLCGERRMRRVSAPAAKQQALMMKQTCDEAD